MKIKLEEHVQVTSGCILKRIKQNKEGNEYSVYGVRDLDADNGILSEKAYIPTNIHVSDDNRKLVVVTGGELVFDTITCKCAIVKSDINPKILPYGYVILEPILSEIYISKEFLKMWFNYSNEAMKQIKLHLQGTQKIKKVSLDALKNFEITIPSKEKQKLIAEISKRDIKLKELRYRKEMLEKKIVKSIF